MKVRGEVLYRGVPDEEIDNKVDNIAKSIGGKWQGRGWERQPKERDIQYEFPSMKAYTQFRKEVIKIPGIIKVIRYR